MAVPGLPFIVAWDPEAEAEFDALRDKGERAAVHRAIDKLARLGEDLRPPHVKTLKGAGGIRELRPRQGRSAMRLLYRRVGGDYVLLALATKNEFDRKLKKAQERAALYD